MNPRELPVDRLATADKAGNRIYLYPADVRGRYRQRRSLLSALLGFVFLTLPWIRIGGQPAILLDIAHLKFAIFGITFWAHDAPLLVFVFGGLILCLAFVTSIWGRIWCGWACPQTVFVDLIFRRVERWIEGDALARKRLDESPFSADKLIKKTAKWAIFSLIAAVISHSFLAYFVGADTVAVMIRQSPLNHLSSFLLMAGVLAAVLFDFGWFREQFCTLVCPYGRFQAVLMDERSQVVGYDASRGEPRRGAHESFSGLGQNSLQGDCVNCYRCVQVCPTGIDIRRGVQLECIACTGCIDACDEVMTRLNKPKGLIRYHSGASTSPPTSRPLRLRPWVLGALLTMLLTGLALTVSDRVPVQATWVRAAEAPYQQLENSIHGQEVINHFKVDLRNQSFQNRRIQFRILQGRENKYEGQGNKDEAQKNKAAPDFRLVASNLPSVIGAGESSRIDIFIQFKKSVLTMGRGKVNVLMETDDFRKDNFRKDEHRKEVILVGPLR